MKLPVGRLHPGLWFHQHLLHWGCICLELGLPRGDGVGQARTARGSLQPLFDVDPDTVPSLFFPCYSSVL